MYQWATGLGNLPPTSFLGFCWLFNHLIAILWRIAAHTVCVYYSCASNKRLFTYKKRSNKCMCHISKYRKPHADKFEFKHFTEFAAYFLVITLLETLAVYPNQFTGEESISDHGHQTTIITILGCSWSFWVSGQQTYTYCCKLQN